MDGAEGNKEKKVPAGQKPLRKSESFTEVKIKCLRMKFAQKDASKRQGGSLSMKKLSRYIELKFEWLGWHEEPAMSVWLWSPNRHLPSGSELPTM